MQSGGNHSLRNRRKLPGVFHDMEDLKKDINSIKRSSVLR